MTQAVAHKAAQLWGFDPSNVALAAHRENTVFRVTDPRGMFALRLHRPGYRSANELQSELMWMAMLSRGGMSVPKPIALSDDSLIANVDGVLVDVLSWLPGAPLGAQGAMDGVEDRTGLARDLGRLLAQLHDLSDQWTPPPQFDRPSWDRAGLLGDDPLWGRFWEHPDLSTSQRALFDKIRRQADATLKSCESRLDFGLIHADALTENIMRDDSTISLIDFDDGGWGYRDFDLATFLLRQTSAPDYQDIRTALIRGYAKRRPIDPAMLDLFLVLRALTYPGWIVPRLSEPGARERSVRAITTAADLAERYLSGEPL